jgi:hypothetical protein
MSLKQLYQPQPHNMTNQAESDNTLDQGGADGLGAQGNGGGSTGSAASAHSTAHSAAQSRVPQQEDLIQERGFGATSMPIIPFNGESTHFQGWRQQAEAVLYNYGLLDVVEKPLPGGAQCASVIGGDGDEVREVTDNASLASGPGPSPGLLKDAKRAYMFLICCIKSPELQAQMVDVPKGNAHEVWSRLLRYFERTSLANKQHLLAEFHNARQVSGESVAQYAARIKKSVLSLATLNEKISASQMQFTFVNGLHDGFNQLRLMLPMLGSKSFETTVDMVLAAESQMALDKARTTIPMQQSGQRQQEQAHYAGAEAGRRAQEACWKCGKTGHVKRQCTAVVTCSHCGKRGHREAACWSKQKAGGASTQPPAREQSAQNGARQAAMTVESVDQAYVAMHVKEDVIPTQSYADAVKNSGGKKKAKDKRMILDSGASKHYVTRDVPMRDAKVNNAVKIRVASGELLQSPTEGEVRFKTNGGDVVKLSGALSHPRMSANLMSVSAICDTGATVTYSKDKAEVRDKAGNVVLEAARNGGVYVLEAQPCEANSAEEVADRLLNEHKPSWHERLGHIAESQLKKLQDAEAVTGLEGVKHTCGEGDQCEGCMKGKAHRKPFGKSMSDRAKPTRPLGRVDGDIWGPFPASLGGSVWMLILVDVYTRMTFGFPLKHKSEAAGRIMEWMRGVQVQQGVKVAEFHSDGGGEFVSNELKKFFVENGTIATVTVPHTPQHNGIVERKNRHIGTMLRSTLHAAGAHEKLWTEAAMTAIHIINHTILVPGTQKTPEGLWRPCAENPSVKRFKVWGCDAWVHVPGSERRKLDQTAQLKMFVGYSQERNAYRLLDVETRKITWSRDVEFSEAKFTQCELFTQQEGGIDSLKGFSENLDRIMFDNEVRFVEMISRQEYEAQQQKLQQQQQVQPQPISQQQHRPRLKDLYPLPPFSPCAPSTPQPMPQLQTRTGSGLSDAEQEQPSTAAGDHNSGTASENGGGHAEVTSQQPVASEAPVRQSQRQRRPPKRFGMVEDGDIGAEGMTAEHEAMSAMIEYAQEMNDPRTYDEAMSSDDKEQWQHAIENELKSLEEHNTWELSQLPPGKRPLPCKWVFRRKYGPDGEVQRFKGRIVVMGCAQSEGVEYKKDQLFAPVLHSKSFRIVGAIVQSLDYEWKQMDVPTAFLNAKIKEEIYVKPPPGMKIVKTAAEEPVMKLKGMLYGLKQAPREWNEEFNESIISLGYQRCLSDTCVYIKKSKTGKSIIMPVFVDDVFPACATEDLPEMMRDIQYLMAKYKIKEVRDAEVVLGVRITRDRKKKILKLDQELYIKKLLKQHNMSESKPAPTPEVERKERNATTNGGTRNTRGTMNEKSWNEIEMEMGEGMEEQGEEGEKEGKDAEDHSHPVLGLVHYRTIVGGLLYLAITTRPDIMHATSMRARKVSDPSIDDWKACKRILRYLNGTTHVGLTYGDDTCGEGVQLGSTYCDADWAGDLSDRKSTTGYIIKVNGATVSWVSKKQSTTAQSSAEAEYYAAGDAIKEILWTRSVLQQMGWAQTEPTILRCDNQAAIAIASDDRHHARTKHIDIRHHFIREHVTENRVKLVWVPTAEQQADILTKPLGRVAYTTLRNHIMGGNCALPAVHS